MIFKTKPKRRRSGRQRTPWYLRRKTVTLVIAAIALAAGFLFNKGNVIQVVDGDTVVVLTGSGPEKVRLYGVDCPESRQKGGREATEFARSLMLFNPVSLSVVETDQYGRKVAVVRLEDGRLANEELVKQGHAWVYRSYCKQPICVSWLAYERQAKKRGLGLWRQPSPTPPWQWRKANPRH